MYEETCLYCESEELSQKVQKLCFAIISKLLQFGLWYEMPLPEKARKGFPFIPL